VRIFGQPLARQLGGLGLGQGAGAAAAIAWTFLDNFTTDDAAPITTPRTCEPGPGTWTVTQTGNDIDLVSGEAVFSGYVSSSDPSLVSVSSYARSIGRALITNVRFSATNARWILFFTTVGGR